MSTKRIPQQTIETVYGPVQISDQRDENDNTSERTVAHVGFSETFTINGKDYSGISLYLRRPSVSGYAASLSVYGYRGQLTSKALDKVAAELMKLPELAEYFDILDDDERKRLRLETAERQIIADAFRTLQDIDPEDAEKIFLRISAKLSLGNTISNVYFGR